MSTTSPPRTGRSVKRLLFAAAVAALGVPVALAAGTPATATARTDVYIRDFAPTTIPPYGTFTDAGQEPSTPASGPTAIGVLNSPDIRVCNSASLPECPADEEPTAGGTSYIFVTLHNPGPYGSGAGDGDLYVYYTVSGAAATWPTDWTQIGVKTVTAAPGTTTVVFTWNVPSFTHVCLLARWVSGTDPMNFEGSSTQTNARVNNNDAWHNINIMVLGPGIPHVLPFALGNVTRVRTLNDLVFAQPGPRFEDAGGMVTVDLGDTLFQQWLQAGGKGQAIRPVGGTQIQILDLSTARISGLPVDPGTRPQITLSFVAKMPSSVPYEVDLMQFGPEQEGGAPTDLGGVAYLMTVGQPAG